MYCLSLSPPPPYIKWKDPYWVMVGCGKNQCWSSKPKLSQPLKWSMECQADFEKLNWPLAAEPVFKHPDPDHFDFQWQNYTVKYTGSMQVALGMPLAGLIQHNSPCVMVFWNKQIGSVCKLYHIKPWTMIYKTPKLYIIIIVYNNDI